jgi:hypothetical protein
VVGRTPCPFRNRPSPRRISRTPSGTISFGVQSAGTTVLFYFVASSISPYEKGRPPVVAAYTRGPVQRVGGLPLVRCIQFVVPDRRWRSCDHDHSALIAEMGSQVWIQGTCTSSHGCLVIDSVPRPQLKRNKPLFTIAATMASVNYCALGPIPRASTRALLSRPTRFERHPRSSRRPRA